jgi:PAS domain S-box-containing protein
VGFSLAGFVGLLVVRGRAATARALAEIESQKKELQDRNEQLQREGRQREAAEAALDFARQRLHTAMDIGRVGTWVWEASTQGTIYDESIRRLVGGAKADDPTFTPDFSPSMVLPEDRANYDAEVAAATRENRGFDFEYRIRRSDGQIRWLHTCGRNETDDRGQLLRVFGASQDITERKQAELLVSGQNQVLAMIAAGAPLKDTLDALLRTVEGIERDMLCSILLLDDDGIRVHPISAPQLPTEYAKALDGLSIGPKAGSCGSAMYGHRQVVVADIETDPLWADYKHLALPHGLRSCWSTPVFDANGKVLGAFAIYGRKPGRPELRHERVIKAVTRTTSVAIESSRAGETLRSANERLQREVADRIKIEQQMRTSRALLQAALEHARMGTWTLEVADGSLIGDEAANLLFAGDPKQPDKPFSLSSFRDVLHVEDRDRIMQILTSAMRGERDYDVEFRIRSNGDGDWHWMAARALLQRDEAGRPLRLVGASFDISERRMSETLIAGQNAVLAMIASGSPLEETLDTLVRVVESVGGESYLGSIMAVDADGKQLRVLSGPNLPAAYQAAIASVGIGPQCGSCGTAVFRREPVIVEDIEHDPLWVDFRVAALESGLRACWSMPVFDSTRRVIGSLAIYSKRAGRLSVKLQHVIEIATQTASIAIENAWAAQSAREANRSLEREVIERRAAESSLQDARAQLQSALMHAQMGSWTLEVGTGMLSFDESLMKVFGTPGQGAVSIPLEQHITRYVYRDDQQRVRDEIEAAVRGETGYDTEYRIFRKQLGVLWLAAKGVVLRDADGKALRFVGISRDVTTHKQSELMISGQNRVLAMIATEAPLPEILDGLEKLVEATEPEARCCIWLLDESGSKLLIASISKQQMTDRGIARELPVDEKYGPSCAAVVRREPVITEDAQTDPLWTASRDRAVQYGIRAAWATPIFDSTREVVGVLAIYSPNPGMSKRRHQQAIDMAVRTAAVAIDSSRSALALRTANEMLEQKVAERTRDLQAANERLQEVDRLKSQFLANMSHELRTPLNAILGFAGTLMMRLPGPLTGEQENQLGIIRNSAQHLLSLINDLLDLAKIESGKMTLRVEEVNCQKVVDEVAGTLQPLAERKRLELGVNEPTEPLHVTTDLRALKQIVINLANNAIKFTDRGHVTLGLQPLRREGQTWVEFSVEDTGIGIREEDRERLFQAFSQMDGTVREGTGLGLHLSQKFAQLIGGRLEFRSEYGKGSRFALLIPGD